MTKKSSMQKARRLQRKNMTNKPIGEIIEAGTTAFVAQCLEVPREIVPRLYDPPPFGSFVKIGKAAPPVTAAEAPPLGIASDAEEEDPFATAFDAPAPVARLGLGMPPAVYALVYGANTASLEPNRRPSALGFADEDEMRLQQPQIFELLRTEFSGLLIAYSEGGRQAPAPSPAAAAAAHPQPGLSMQPGRNPAADRRFVVSASHSAAVRRSAGRRPVG